jgi:hypothetical protein
VIRTPKDSGSLSDVDRGEVPLAVPLAVPLVVPLAVIAPVRETA